MLALKIKPVLELVPETLGLIKKAHMEEDYPVNNRDSCLASNLVAAYEQHIKKKVVDFSVLEKLAHANSAYGIKDQVRSLTETLISRFNSRLEKQASTYNPQDYEVDLQTWQASFSGLSRDICQLKVKAEELLEKAAAVGVEAPDDVKLYAGVGVISKQAAINALSSRYHVNNDPLLLKLAQAISSEPDFIFRPLTVKALSQTVSELDKKAGLSSRGFDFHKEAMLTKKAAISQTTVTVAGKAYPLQAILNLPDSYVDSYLGKGFTEEITRDPSSAKALVESLPMDSQKVLNLVLSNAG